MRGSQAAPDAPDRVKKFTLTRLQAGPDIQLGIITRYGRRVCVTLEPPWRDNQRGISCIPAGEYWVTVVQHSFLGRCILVHGVPDRDPIYIHVGNTRDNTRGCILAGVRFGTLDGQPAVLHSKAAVHDLADQIGAGAVLEVK